MKKNIISLCAALYVVLIACMPFARAFEWDDHYHYIFDGADLMSDTERADLDSAAEQIAAEYNFGAYIITTLNYEHYGFPDIEDCAAELYHYYDLGESADRNGLLLLLSMVDRDYALYAYGYGNTAFTDSGKYSLADDYFLNGFRDNDWYQGFADYLSGVESYLKQASAGRPVDDYGDYDHNTGNGGYTGYDGGGGYHEYYENRRSLSPWDIFMFTGLPCAISGLICLGMKSRMKTVRKASGAGNYIPDGGFHLRVRDDRFTHTTESRVKIEREHNNHHDHGGGGGGFSGGGTTIRSDGGSSSSGKF